MGIFSCIFSVTAWVMAYFMLIAFSIINDPIFGK